MIQAILKTYPWMDHMMAETLVVHHEEGTLSQYVEDWPDQEARPVGSEVVVGAVTVEEARVATSERSGTLGRSPEKCDASE